MTEKHKQTERTTTTHHEQTVPVSQVRDVFARIVREGRFLRNENGSWLFTEKAPFSGLNLHAYYTSEDQAIDAVVGVYFPNMLRAAA